MIRGATLEYDFKCEIKEIVKLHEELWNNYKSYILVMKYNHT
jgi:hypothetical protein